MTDEVKLRLYVTAIVIVMAIIYIGPLLVNSQSVSLRSELMSSCYMATPGLGIDYCWQEADKKVGVPVWGYLLSYLPAVVLLWFNWLLKPTLRLSDDSYPWRTMNVFLWLGLLVAALGIWFPIWEVISKSVVDLHEIKNRELFSLPWTAAGWLIAPLLFNHLLAPAASTVSMRKFKIALLLLVAAPIVAGTLLILREVIRNTGG